MGPTKFRLGMSKYPNETWRKGISQRDRPRGWGWGSQTAPSPHAHRARPHSPRQGFLEYMRLELRGVGFVRACLSWSWQVGSGWFKWTPNGKVPFYRGPNPYTDTQRLVTGGLLLIYLCGVLL